MKCTECNPNESRPCILFCKTHSLGICAKCGANKHRDCPPLLDCADLVKATQDMMDLSLDELKKEGGSTEEERKRSSFRSPDELHEMLLRVETKMGDNKELKDACSLLIAKKLEERLMSLQKKANSCAQSIEKMTEKMEARLKNKTQLIQELEDQRALLEGKKGDDMFDHVYEEYVKYKGLGVAGIQGVTSATLQALDASVQNYIDNVELKSIQENLKFVFEKPTLVTHAEQTGDNYVHYLNSLSHELFIYDIELKLGKRVEMFLENGAPFDLPEGFDTIAVKDSIYITGGTKDSEKCLASTYEHSLLRERVVRRADMNEARKEHIMEYNADHVYCIAGRNDGGLTSSCERYRVTQSCANGEWEQVPSLCESRIAPSACAIRDPLNPVIYVFGGLGPGGCVDYIEMLLCNNIAQKWIKIEVKTCEGWKSRYGAGIFPVHNELHNEIVIFGGTEETDFNDTFIIDLKSKTMQACPTAQLPEGISFAQRKCVCTRDCTKACIIGSFNVHCFDVEAKKWEIVKEDEWHPL